MRAMFVGLVCGHDLAGWLDDVCVCEQLVSVVADPQSVSIELRARESELGSVAAQLRSSMETQLQSLTMTLASK